MSPRSPAAWFLALVPLGIMAGLGWSFAWTTGETAGFLLGFTVMIVTPGIVGAILASLERGHLLFALWAVAAWVAILPGAFELEERFVDLRLAEQRAQLEGEAARIAERADVGPSLTPTETDEACSPLRRAWALRTDDGVQVWFLRRLDRALVHAPGSAFGPYTASECRHIDGPWFDCAF